MEFLLFFLNSNVSPDATSRETRNDLMHLTNDPKIKLSICGFQKLALNFNISNDIDNNNTQ
jgi:hypothetical protein